MTVQLTDYFVFILIVLAGFFDLTQKRIPNMLTFPAILLGLIIFTVTGGLHGLLQGLLGFGFGIVIFLIPFILGGMGAGDVKLMGAIGALKGLEFIVYTAFFTGLCGGVLALGYLIINGQFLIALKKAFYTVFGLIFKKLFFRSGISYFNRQSVRFESCLEELRKSDRNKKIYMPYGVAIAMGALLVLIDVLPKFLDHILL